MIATTRNTPLPRCGYQFEAGLSRCMLPAEDHPACMHCGAVQCHEYVSLMTPCLHCPAAISWTAGEWRDSRGGTQGHVPDPSFL